MRKISINDGDGPWAANTLGEHIIQTGKNGKMLDTWFKGNTVMEAHVHEGGHSALDL